MASRTYNTFIILSLIILFGCRTQQDRLQAIVPQQPQPSLPEMNIPLPNTSFQFLLPPSPGLTEYVSPHKPITQNFSSREINHLSVEDPLRFKDSNTELIDLSSLQTDEYAFPLPNAKVISPYGGRRRNHTGVDIKTFANEHFTHTSVFLKFAIEASISFLISSFPKPVCAENGISGTCSIVLKMSL